MEGIAQMTALVEAGAIAAEASLTLTGAQTFKVATTAQYEEAGAKLQAIKALSKKLDETFDPHIKRAFEAHRGLVSEKKTHQTPLQTAEALIKRAMLGYQQDEERKRQELEARAAQEARKERERLEAQAAKLTAQGKTEKAEVKAAQAAAVVAPMIAPTTPKLAGISTRTTYRAEVYSLMELVKAVAACTVPINALQPDQAFLNNQARAMKETLAYPGVKAVAETGLSSRSA
jgi:hypothetical protein